jgi:hypothetical protein
MQTDAILDFILAQEDRQPPRHTVQSRRAALYCRARTIILASALAPTIAFGGVSVTTWHNDLARTGLNPFETTLTLANVRPATFGKLCALPVDGQIYAQPLYVPALQIHGSVHDVVFIGTEHDSVYAFDATCAANKPLWAASFLNATTTPMPCTADKQPQCDITVLAPEHGITATPVIDPGSNTIFVGAQTVESGIYQQKLHALDLRTGAERPGSPVTINATVPAGKGKNFNPQQAFQRAALLLLNGIVYFPFSSNDSANGWLLGYDRTTLKQASVFPVTPTGTLGGIWGGGAAPAVDQAGNIFTATGNGTFDADRGGQNYGMSVLHLVPAGGGLTVRDYFTPSDDGRLTRHDLDLDSGGLVLLPDQPGAHPREAVIGFKTGMFFLLDRDNLGHHGNFHAIQHFRANPQGFWSTAAFWNSNVYLAGVSAKLTQWPLKNGLFPSSPSHQTRNQFSYPGATPSISSLGTENAIVWTIDTQGRVQGGNPAVLRANDALDVSKQLYSSDASGTRDTAGLAVKFSVPTVADGKVFVGTQSELDIYGLLH